MLRRLALAVLLVPLPLLHSTEDKGRRGRSTMADITRCNDTCGCDVPCLGGVACRCDVPAVTTAVVEEHALCSCGEHCGCNPCRCGRTSEAVPAGLGRAAACRCGPGCTCTTCDVR